MPIQLMLSNHINRARSYTVALYQEHFFHCIDHRLTVTHGCTMLRTYATRIGQKINALSNGLDGYVAFFLVSRTGWICDHRNNSNNKVFNRRQLFINFVLSRTKSSAHLFPDGAFPALLEQHGGIVYQIEDLTAELHHVQAIFRTVQKCIALGVPASLDVGSRRCMVNMEKLASDSIITYETRKDRTGTSHYEWSKHFHWQDSPHAGIMCLPNIKYTAAQEAICTKSEGLTLAETHTHGQFDYITVRTDPTRFIREIIVTGQETLRNP